jgi:drug/metabolite transporter (DMT)-like permease
MNDVRRKMSPTIVVGLVLAVVGVAFVAMVVDKLGIPGKLRKRHRANLRRAKARQY